MKLKHNKKRNTAFLYEALVKELTKAIINKEPEKKAAISSVIKENFSKSTLLGKELGLYKTLDETISVDVYTAERLVTETRRSYDSLDKDKIFENQTSLINLINKNISTGVFSNFVPNYKNLATIAQIFNDDLTPKERVLLERNLISAMSSKQPEVKSKNMVPIDSLVYKKIIEGFNEKYGTDLLEEQRELLKNYIVSFSDNGLSLKMFLNEEIGRLKEKTSEVLKVPEVSSDQNMTDKANRILERLNSFKKGATINEDMIEFVLKTQKLISETIENGD
tara:strand:+ start:448 stop:1284 length:837 start_codon:yes stop_codon:yes gene_type:complete